MKLVEATTQLFSIALATNRILAQTCSDQPVDTIPPTECDIVPGAPTTPSPALALESLTPETNFNSDLTLEQAEKLINSEINSNDRVVNGFDVTDPNEAPFYSRILSCSEGTSGCGLCGSSWITGKQLLTAAHCVDANVAGNKPNHKVYAQNEKK